MDLHQTFENAEHEYFNLRGRLEAGRITRQQFEDALKELMIQDSQQRWWMLGVDSGKWYVNTSEGWVEADPASGQATAASPRSAAPERLPSGKPVAIIIAVLVLFVLAAVGIVAFANNTGLLQIGFLGASSTATRIPFPTLTSALPAVIDTPIVTATSTLISTPTILAIAPTLALTLTDTTATPSPTPLVIVQTATQPPPFCPGPPVIAFFTASPLIITAGQPTTLNWGPVSNASAAVIEPALGGVPTPGSRVVFPLATTTFTLFATGCGGTSVSQVTIVVNPTPAATATRTRTPVPPQFAWDFSPCNAQGTSSSATQVFDPGQTFGGVWVGNGCVMRFLTGGQSWMQIGFTLNADPQTWNPQFATLSFFHLSSSPGGGQPGYSPVRVSLNGATVWQGSPGTTNTGPGGLWAANSAVVTSILRQGGNTLRWDFLTGATTHYWLKSFRISW